MSPTSQVKIPMPSARPCWCTSRLSAYHRSYQRGTTIWFQGLKQVYWKDKWAEGGSRWRTNPKRGMKTAKRILLGKIDEAITTFLTHQNTPSVNRRGFILINDRRSSRKTPPHPTEDINKIAKRASIAESWKFCLNAEPIRKQTNEMEQYWICDGSHFTL